MIKKSALRDLRKLIREQSPFGNKRFVCGAQGGARIAIFA
jgi:hypothetical protein